MFDFLLIFAYYLFHSIGGKMYAIIETGGKQYKVAKDQVIEVELLECEKDSVAFEHVLFYHDGQLPKVGTPYVEKCKVLGEVLDEIKGSKVIAYKYKKRKNYHRKVGHRQKYLKVKITDIKLGK